MSNQVEVDGAHEGLRPSDAFKVAVGDTTEIVGVDRRMSEEELEKEIRSTPLPDQAEYLFLPGSELTDADYDRATYCLAHCYLTLLEDENPPPIESNYVHTDEEVNAWIDAHPNAGWEGATREDIFNTLKGQPKGKDHDLVEAARKRWPNLQEFAGGFTGMMAGMAYNYIRALKGQEPAENPAILHIDGE